MKFIIPVENIITNNGGLILYDPIHNAILSQYVHNKHWIRSGWRGGVVYKDYFITTDWQDLHYFNLKTWKYEYSYKNTVFNDLHYLVINDDKLYIVNTGLDSIEIFHNPLKPIFINRRFVFQSNLNRFTQRDINLNREWNKEYKIRPHVCHPNCLTIHNDMMLTTCFENETRGHKTGCIIDINNGKILLDKHNCHDGIIYKGDFYTSGTRENKIYIIKNIIKRRKNWPLKPDDVINIKEDGWWRGMIIKDDILVLFASYGYGKTRASKVAVVDLKTKLVAIKTLPQFEGRKWDTVYQPQLFEV